MSNEVNVAPEKVVVEFVLALGRTYAGGCGGGDGSAGAVSTVGVVGLPTAGAATVSGVDIVSADGDPVSFNLLVSAED
jgi:hypothetical protein